MLYKGVLAIVLISIAILARGATIDVNVVSGGTASPTAPSGVVMTLETTTGVTAPDVVSVKFVYTFGTLAVPDTQRDLLIC